MTKFILLLLPVFSFAQTPTVSCDCPKVECPACMRSEGITFFSEKCGEAGAKTRSCAKPTCVADPMADAGKCAKAPAQAADSMNPTERQPTSAAPAANVVGAVKVVKGQVSIVGADGNTRTVVEGDPIHEHDSMVTNQAGAAMIEFDGGNRVHVMENTRVNVQEYQKSDAAKTAILNLIKGKIRNQVKEKYDGKASSYKVVTPGVVAGVRGTDFVVTEEDTDHGITRVETLEGAVQLNERLGVETATVEKGHAVTYRMDDGAKEADSDWSNRPRKGAFNPVYKMTTQQLAQLDGATLLMGEPTYGKPVKKADPTICKGPNGKLNQCAWKCKNNPKDAKTCRTEDPNVSCVRMRCNANGDWSEETRLPASAAEECEASGSHVDACDY